MSGFLSRNFRKPQLIPTLFIISSTIMMLFLGSWQLQRLEWKNQIIKDVEKAQALDPLSTLPHDISELDYRKVILLGTFLHDKTLHLIGRQQGNFPGYFIVTPLKLEDGRIILINRGFSPAGKETKPENIQTIAGIIRPPRIKRYFAPENIPEKNVWFYEDIPAMSQKTGLEILPVIVEEVGKTAQGEFPIKGDGRIFFKNDHLGYAITWFLTAFIGLIMFAIYHRKIDNSEKEIAYEKNPFGNVKVGKVVSLPDLRSPTELINANKDNKK
jgi:surfeit locus 1 family protein